MSGVPVLTRGYITRVSHAVEPRSGIVAPRVSEGTSWENIGFDVIESA
jgi:hypothetical protein